MRLSEEMRRYLSKDNAYVPHVPAKTNELFNSRWGYLGEGEETILVSVKTSNKEILERLNNIAYIKWGSNLMMKIGGYCIETPPIQHIESDNKYVRFDIENGTSYLFRRLRKFS